MTLRGDRYHEQRFTSDQRLTSQVFAAVELTPTEIFRAGE
ncbi:MAG: hypothetical protein AAFW75_02265 [Cyanobacteria bacterium J06636_16]